jgi:hypothetical protein
MIMKKMLSVSLALLGLTACASTGPLPDQEMSAREHEQAATTDRREARQVANQYENRAVRYVDLYPSRPPSCDSTLSGSCSPYWTMTKNPTDRELALASAYRERAAEHRKQARALREAEERACALVSLADQDMSPLLRQRDIAAVDTIAPSSGRGPQGAPAGAAIAFGQVTDLNETILQRIVDCQLARNAALGWDQSENQACPLNVRGASAHVRTAAGHLVVEVTSRDAGAALEILNRARALLPARVSAR